MKGFKRFIQESKTPSFNQGHAYEFVLAAAMVSKFTDRYDDGSPETLTPASVEDVMKQYFRGNTLWNVAEGDDQVDVVEFDGAGLPRDVLEILKDDSFRKDKIVKDMVNTAIRAVNANSTLTKLSMEVITNNKSDDVTVACGGTEGQMTTKSDVNVFVNDREQRKAGFSVKYGGVQQVGQFAGVDAAKNLIDGFGSFGLNVRGLSSIRNLSTVLTTIKGVYEPPASKDDPDIIRDKSIVFPAVRKVFEDVISRFGSKWLSKNADSIMSGLRKAALGREDDVEIIKGSLSYDKRTFDGISRGLRIAAENNKTEWRMESGENPTIGLYADGMKLFQVRFRYDRDRKKDVYKVRFRLYVEIAPTLSKFADMHK